MVTNKTFRNLQERYEACVKSLFGATRKAAELQSKLDLERTSRENAEKRAEELELRIKPLTRTIADVEEILHDA